MTTNPISGAGAATSPADAATALRDDGLDRDAFLQLLVTQLRHQDPSRPQDSQEFLAQLAQFSALEKLISIEQGVRDLSAQLAAALQATDAGVEGGTK
jgi:flagellar basal-body rod modification protein FlgD